MARRSTKQTSHGGSGGKGGGGRKPAASDTRGMHDGKAASASGSAGAFRPAISIPAIAGLLLATAASLMLALAHFKGMELPGCGPGSACDLAAKSAWGRVPGLNFPVSLVGLAYFAAMLAGYVASAGRVHAVYRWVARGGAVMSLVFVGAMLVNGYLCHFCLAAHAGNILFVAMLELGSRRTEATGGMASVTAALVVGALGISALAMYEANLNARALQALEDSTKKIITSSQGDGSGSPQNDGTTVTNDQPDGHASTSSAAPFTGRWRQGPEEAAIRIVIISDYQCPDCKRIEAEARVLAERVPSLSLSAKHYPMCADCNPQMKGANPHPNACWAARAAEAAGILGGNEAFWKMHHWLFNRSGAFTDPELRAGLTSMGFDVEAFISLMRSDETLARVQQDIAEAHGLGLMFTPMIFINGVELRGWQVPNALTQAVESLAKQNLPVRSAANDRPPAAKEKAIGDWREWPMRVMPRDTAPMTRGPANAKVQVTIWADATEPNMAKLWKELGNVIKGRTDVRIDYRNYPFDQNCNQSVSRTLFPRGCVAARAIEAANIVGGSDAAFSMLEWILANQQAVSEANVIEHAGSAGLDTVSFITAMQSTSAAQNIAEDCASGKVMIPRGLPTLYINGKHVPRWDMDGTIILKDIIEEASR